MATSRTQEKINVCIKVLTKNVDFWPDRDSAEPYGIKFVGSDVTVAEGCPDQDFSDKPLQVTFGR